MEVNLTTSQVIVHDDEKKYLTVELWTNTASVNRVSRHVATYDTSRKHLGRCLRFTVNPEGAPFEAHLTVTPRRYSVNEKPSVLTVTRNSRGVAVKIGHFLAFVPKEIPQAEPEAVYMR